MTLRITSALLLLAVSAFGHRQGTANEGRTELDGWVTAYHAAVQAYGRGDVESAARVVSERPIETQRRIVAAVLGILERRAAGEMSRTAWTIRDATIAGAMHMDVALLVHRAPAPDTPKVVPEHITLGEALLLLAERHGTAAPHSAARWQLALGLTLLAEGQWSRAEAILCPASEKYAPVADLQLACGSAHETLAILPGNLLAGLRQRAAYGFDARLPASGTRVVTPDTMRPPAASLSSVKADRQTHLRRAAETLARAVKMSPGEAEPALRLAHVKLLQADAAGAIHLLEPLVSGEREPRVAYLARLFIASSHQRLGRPQESNRLLEEALRVMPSGQSAYVALASSLHASGDRSGASAVLRRMLAAPAAPDDPWVGYRFGQFWVPGPLLAELRDEARRR